MAFPGVEDAIKGCSGLIADSSVARPAVRQGDRSDDSCEAFRRSLDATREA